MRELQSVNFEVTVLSDCQLSVPVSGTGNKSI